MLSITLKAGLFAVATAVAPPAAHTATLAARNAEVSKRNGTEVVTPAKVAVAAKETAVVSAVAAKNATASINATKVVPAVDVAANASKATAAAAVKDSVPQVKTSAAPQRTNMTKGPLPKLQVGFASTGHLTAVPDFMKSSPNFMAKAGAGAADKCSCMFNGICSCTASIEFMDCVSNACSSGDCDCHDTQFSHACSSLADVCTTLELQCFPERAACMVEQESEVRAVTRTKEMIYDELLVLKEKRCRLELAKADGWLNADLRLKEVNVQIEDKMQELADQRAPLPEMHCEKHFEEWHISESQKAVSTESGETVESVKVKGSAAGRTSAAAAMSALAIFALTV